MTWEMSASRSALLLIVIGAVLLMAAAVAHGRRGHHAVWVYEPASYRGDTPHQLTARLAPIGEFDREVEGDERNPFVPYQLRLAHQESHDDARGDGQAAPTPMSTRQPQPLAEAPPWQLPSPTLQRSRGPRCFGMIEAPRGRSVLVRMPGSDATHRLEVGGSMREIGGSAAVWTLIGIERAGQARFRDPSGREASFVITLQDPLSTIR